MRGTPRNEALTLVVIWQLAHAQQIAAWEAKKVMVGGVEMTNAEPLRVLRGVRDNRTQSG